MQFTALNNLNTVIGVLGKNAFTIGLSVALLMVSVYAIKIMFDNDSSPAAQSKRWDTLYRVIICAVIITASGAAITFARQFGGAI